MASSLILGVLENIFCNQELNWNI